MFIRFHEAKEEREGGFTLIELLVVILIIAILAAIAIPVFLRQREKGWRSQAQSALKNAATAQESYLTTNPTYATAATQLVAEGYKAAPEVNLTVISANATAYCMSAGHDSINNGAAIYWYDSDNGAPSTTACT